MRLDLDTEIRFPNGVRAGVLQKVIVGETGHVDSVIMSTDEIVSRNVIVPVSALSEGAGDVLTLNLTPDQVDDLPDYEEEAVPVAPEGWEWDNDSAPGDDVFPATLHDPGMMPVMEVGNVPEGSTGINQGTEIWCEGERWGIVDEVLLNDEGNVSAFVGRPDNTKEHDRIIPVDLVSEYGPLAVTLSCTLTDLPNYTEEIVNELEEPDAE
jgi:hypothetical protein